MIPRRLATWVGLIGFIVCGIMCIDALVSYLSGHTVTGWTSTFIALSFIGGTQLLCLGVLGEYVAQIYRTVQGRPTYQVAYDSLEVGDIYPAQEPRMNNIISGT